MAINEKNITVFRNQFNPDKTIDPVEYSLRYLKNYPGTKIYVGCDSQNKGRHTIYATVICYRWNARGVHVIYHKEKVDRLNDLRTRLWDECLRALDVATTLSDNGIEVHQVDLDYNSDKERGASYELIHEGRGYIVGLGYKAGVKPEELVAARAADNIASKA